MSWVATAIAGSSALSAGASIFGGVMGSSAAKKQAAATIEAANIASRTALQIDDRARSDVAPFRQLGMDAGDMVSKILKGEAKLDDVLRQSSIFKWQSGEAERLLNRQLSARGEFNSGAGIEALARLDTQLVAEEGIRYWDRLFNTTTLGSNAAARMATNTTQTGNNVAGIQAQLGAASANAEGAAGRSIAGIGSGVSNAISGGVGSYMQYSLFKPILDKYAGGGGGNGNSTRGDVPGTIYDAPSTSAFG